MKHLLILFIGLFLSVSVMGQDKEELSNAEKFLEQSGTLLKKEYKYLGSVRGSILEVVTITDLLNSETTHAVRFEYAYLVGTSTQTGEAYLDADELEGLISSVRKMLNETLDSRPENEAEVVFTSRSGFKAGCIWDESSWTPFVKGNRYRSNSFINLRNKKNLQKFLALLLDAKINIKK